MPEAQRLAGQITAVTGGGSIVNISSIRGIVGSFANAACHAPKGAVRIFAKPIAINWTWRRIRLLKRGV